MSKCKHCGSNMSKCPITCSRCGGVINAMTRKERSKLDEGSVEEQGGYVWLVLAVMFLIVLVLD